MKGPAFLVLCALALAQGSRIQFTASGKVCNCDPGQADNVCRQSSSDGSLIVHENCNQFYQCVHGQPVTQNCNNGLLYDPIQERCEWPDTVNCGTRPIVEIAPAPVQPDEDNEDGAERPCNCNPSEAPTICSRTDSEGVLIAHENCNQFYQCDHGVPVTQNCAAGLVYDAYIQRCEWPYNVECGSRPIVEIETGGNNGNSGEQNPNEDCGGWSCYCDPAEAPAICAIDRNNGEIVAHENCNQFYQCVNGKPVALVCQNGLLFNINIGRCDWPQNVFCGDRQIVEIDEDCEDDNSQGENGGSGGSGGGSEGGSSGGSTCNCRPGEAPSICSADESEGVLVAHENCNQFYKCSHGEPVTQDCPAGLMYDPYVERCEWPHNVDCGDRPIVETEKPGNPSEEDCEDNNGENGGSGGSGGGSEGGGSGGGTCNCNPGEAPSICSADESEGVLVAHENCNQFYKCSHGEPVTQNCPAGLMYDPYIERCEWPHNVDCGDRPVVEIDNGGDGSGGDGENGGSGGSGGGSEGSGSEGGGSGGGGSGGGTCNCSPGEAPSICSADESEGVLVAHENCNQFYKCSHGEPVTQNCPAGLMYDPYIERCEWPHNVDCGDRPVVEIDNGGDGSGGDGENGGSGGSGGGSEGGGSEGGGSGGGGSGGGTCNCSPGEAPSICSADESEGVLVAHENCNQFYKCSHGEPVTQNCPAGLMYDPYIERCEWPHNVDCGDRPVVEIDNGGDGSGGDGENGGSGGSGGGSEGGGSEGGGSGGGGSGGGTCNCSPGEAPSICSADESEGVLVAHENCNQFYKCSHGEPVTQDCPAGLMYDPYIERCEWPHNVECGDRPVAEIDNGGDGSGGDGENGGSGGSGGGSEGGGSEGGGSGGGGSGGGTCNCSPGEAPSICSADESEGVLVAHENCNQFYKCSHGEPVTQDCPAGLMYDPYIERCEWPHNVECGDRPVAEIDNGGDGSGGDGENGGSGGSGGGSEGGGSEGGGSGGGGSGGGTCNCSPGEAPSICSADESEGVLVAHENCNQFYKCSHGEPVTQDCPAGLMYDPYVERCEWPHNVKCGDRPVAEIDNGTGEGGNGGSSGSGGGSEGVGSESGGSGDNNNNDNDEECEENNDGTCNCNPSDAVNICIRNGSDGDHVAHENCNQFYKCSHGVPVALFCPAGLLYDPRMQRCDWPYLVNCGDRPIVDIEDNNQSNENNGDNGDNGNSCNCNPAEAPTICAADNSESVLVAHEKCNYFYKCSFGKPVPIRCNGDLLYNPYSRACDWPQNVECENRIISDSSEEQDREESEERTVNGHCDPSQAPAICAAHDSEDVLVAHENCNKFYVCHDGLPLALPCATNLLYNPTIEQCDWPQNVECGDRTVPETEPPGECACDSKMALSMCADNNSDGKFVAHGKCDQFYLCVGGIPVEFSCPAGLFYEPYTQSCNWPAAVNCDGRDVTSLYSFSKHLGARRGIF